MRRERQEEEEQTPFGFPFSIPFFSKPLTQEKIISALTAVAIAVVQLLLVLCLSTFISVGVVYLVKNRVTPKGNLIEKRLYFDFEEERPLARVDLFSNHDQWDLFDDRDAAFHDATVDHRKTLKSDFRYRIDAVFSMSKSEKNYQEGKFMTTLTLFDVTGDIAARSRRPVVMPFRTQWYIFFETIVNLSTLAPLDTTNVYVSFMEDYVQTATGSPTKYLELEMSTNAFDVEDVHVSLVPHLEGLSFYFYHYPWPTFIIFVLLVDSIQVFFIFVTFGLSWLINLLSRAADIVYDEEDDEGNGDFEDDNNDGPDDFNGNGDNYRENGIEESDNHNNDDGINDIHDEFEFVDESLYMRDRSDGSEISAVTSAVTGDILDSRLSSSTPDTSHVGRDEQHSDSNDTGTLTPDDPSNILHEDGLRRRIL